MCGLPWTIQGAQCHHKGPYEGKKETGESDREL